MTRTVNTRSKGMWYVKVIKGVRVQGGCETHREPAFVATMFVVCEAVWEMKLEADSGIDTKTDGEYWHKTVILLIMYCLNIWDSILAQFPIL